MNPFKIDIQNSDLLTKTIRQSPNTKIGIEKAYIINIDERKDRLNWMMKQCNSVDIWGVRVPAVKGSSIDINKMRSQNLIGDGKLLKNEYACYLSHIKCWDLISKEPDTSKLFMVLEDDVIFSKYFTKSIIDNKKFLQLTPGFVRLGLDVYNKDNIKIITPTLYETGLATGTWGYILRSDQASYLLQNSYPINYPVDLTIGFNLDKFPETEQYDRRFMKTFRSYVLHSTNVKVNLEYPGYFARTRLGVLGEISTSINDSSTSKDKTFKINCKPWLFIILFFFVVIFCIWCKKSRN
jgi:GR25 family glycosyltransferase involved in LPS biosynthesis